MRFGETRYWMQPCIFNVSTLLELTKQIISGWVANSNSKRLMSIGEDTTGLWLCSCCSTLLLATVAGSWSLVGAAGLQLGAFRRGVGTGIAAAAHVGVAAVSAPAAGGLVEVEAHSLGEARFSVKVSRRTDILSVITTQANIAVGLSEACESDCPLLKVYLIPAQGQVIGRTATELLVVR